MKAEKFTALAQRLSFGLGAALMGGGIATYLMIQQIRAAVGASQSTGYHVAVIQEAWILGGGLCVIGVGLIAVALYHPRAISK